MEANGIQNAFLLGILIVMSASPAIFLLCIADKFWHKALAICLFVISLAGLIGLKQYFDATPTQINNLYNYGEKIE